MRRVLALGAAVLTAVGLSAALSAPLAAALPGQCVSTPFGGFCDGAAEADTIARVARRLAVELARSNE